MRELKKQDMIDILYGCAVLGTGGGGPLEEGLAMMQKHFDNDEVLQLISLDELPDDEYVVTPYGCGAPSATGLNPKFKDLEVSEVVPSVLAMEALEEALGKKIYAVGSTELGGANTAEALHAALEKGVPLLDADPAGRSVPELQHSTYYVKGVPIYPMGVATRFGEKIVIQNVQNDLRAEDIVRAIAVASDNMVGVADHANVGKVIKESLIPDMITYAQDIGQILRETKEKGADALDAPVSGGDLGAKNGTLTIMVGGEEAVYDQVLPLFKEFGTTFTLHGSAGKGQHTKMANQIMIAGTMTGMTEMLVYAQKNGLDLKKVIETLSGGSAANWSLSNYSPRILKEDYTPGFFVKHFIKDLKIALEEAEKMDLVLPATTQALKLYEELADKGFENDGTQALIKLWWPEGKIPEKKS